MPAGDLFVALCAACLGITTPSTSSWLSAAYAPCVSPATPCAVVHSKLDHIPVTVADAFPELKEHVQRTQAALAAAGVTE